MKEFLKGATEIVPIPMVWLGYVLIIPIVYTLIMGMNWIALALFIVFLADRVWMHYQFLMTKAKGNAMVIMHEAMLEWSALAQEVEREQQAFVAKKMRENEE